MPLCPSCISPHSDYHDKNGFRASYSNINEILLETHDRIYDSISHLEQLQKRNVYFKNQIEQFIRNYSKLA
jgi:hypothetical protein